MTSTVALRTLRRLTACLLIGGTFHPDLASAQTAPFSTGFASLPSFAWPQPIDAEYGRRSGSYAAVSTGFALSSSKSFGSYAGPTLGLEAGRLWQEGRFVYGVSGGFDTLAGMGGAVTPGFGRLGYARDFAGGVQVKVGALLSPDVLLYGKAGALAVHDTLRVGPTSVSQPFAREDIVVRPDARVGVEWAVTDRLSVAVEAGVTGPGLR